MSGHPLKIYREKHNPPLSQDQMAMLLGVSRVTVTRWESGARLIGKDKLSLVTKFTGIAPRKLRPDLAKLFEGAA